MAERAVVASKRIDNITEHLTYEIFLYFQRGLFERHKIVFALMLAFAVLISSGKVSLLVKTALINIKRLAIDAAGPHVWQASLDNTLSFNMAREQQHM